MTVNHHACTLVHLVDALDAQPAGRVLSTASVKFNMWLMGRPTTDKQLQLMPAPTSNIWLGDLGTPT